MMNTYKKGGKNILVNWNMTTLSGALGLDYTNYKKPTTINIVSDGFYDEATNEILAQLQEARSVYNRYIHSWDLPPSIKTKPEIRQWHQVVWDSDEYV